MDQPPFRLKTTVSGHEFDAEGPVEVVSAAFQAFMQAVAVMPTAVTTPRPVAQPAEQPTSDDSRSDTVQPTQSRQQDSTTVDAGLAKIMRTEGRVISLTVRPRNVDEAALLLLYGQRAIRENDSVTGSELISGLTTTGGIGVGRVDRTMEKLARDNDAIVIGERRAKRYRLTNAGLAKARALAADLIATVA
jgi:hypothetical protein